MALAPHGPGSLDVCAVSAERCRGRNRKKEEDRAVRRTDHAQPKYKDWQLNVITI